MSLSLSVFRLFSALIGTGISKEVLYLGEMPAGPKIWAINHPTTFDPLYVYELLDSPLLMIKKWGWDIPIVGRIIDRCGFFPVGEDPRSKHNAFIRAKSALLMGRSVLMCPEGEMTRESSHAHTGAVRLSYETGTPIIPIGIKHVAKVRVFTLRLKGDKRSVIKYVARSKTRIVFGRPTFGFECGACGCLASQSEALLMMIKHLCK